MRVGSFVLSLIIVLGPSIVGCVSDPTFDQADGTTTTTDTTIGTHGMVLVPTTILSKVQTQDTKGKEKGKNDDDAKKPTPAPAPAPSSGTTTTGALVVPAFWIDAAAVSPADYDACTNARACSPPSCESLGVAVACITHAQASQYCAFAKKRLVRNAEWSAAAEQMPAGLTGLSGGFSEWVEEPGIARGGATSNASTTLGHDSSIPTVGFRCARDR